MDDLIRVVVKRPGEVAYISDIRNDLASKQRVVNGPIQYLPGDALGLVTGIDMYCHEEAKMINLEPNVWVFDRQDQIWGTFLLLGADEDTGENRSLTAEESALALAWCAEKGRSV